MSEGWVLFYIWLSGFILSLPIVINWANYKEPDGRTMVDLTKVLLTLIASVIGNWGVVACFLWCAGMWILVKIGELLSPLGDITFYESGPPEKKKEKKL